MFGGRIVLIIYLVIGLVIAASKNYLDIDNVKDIISAALAIVLWPLVLFGVNLHIGRIDNDGKGKRLLLPAAVHARFLAARVAALFSR